MVLRKRKWTRVLFFEWWPVVTAVAWFIMGSGMLFVGATMYEFSKSLYVIMSQVRTAKLYDQHLKSEINDTQSRVRVNAKINTNQDREITALWREFERLKARRDKGGY